MEASPIISGFFSPIMEHTIPRLSHCPGWPGCVVPMPTMPLYWNLKPKYGLTAYVPLDEQNKKNGGLAYYCGSHNGPTYKHKKSKVKAFSSYVDDKLFKNYKLEYVDVKPGDLILHHCNTAHKTSKNLTNKHRNAVAITIYGEHAKIDSKMKNIRLIKARANKTGINPIVITI